MVSTEAEFCSLPKRIKTPYVHYICENPEYPIKITQVGENQTERGGKEMKNNDRERRKTTQKLKKLAEQLGYSPSQNEAKSTSVKQARYHFGTWNNAKLVAGLPIWVKNSWSRDKVKAELRKLAERLGYSPRARETNYGLQRAAKKYFGSWNDAKLAIGLEIGVNKFNNHYISKKMLENER